MAKVSEGQVLELLGQKVFLMKLPHAHVLKSLTKKNLLIESNSIKKASPMSYNSTISLEIINKSQMIT